MNSEFHYTGRRMGSGAKVSGTSQARNAAGAAQWLRTQGILPLEIRCVDHPPKGIPWPWSPRPGDGELLFFTRQMAAITHAGVPLARAMQGMAEGAPSPVLRRALTTIMGDLQSGHALSTAMANHPNLFASLYVKMVRMGEETGRLDEAFQRMHHYLQSERQSQRRLMAALRYPLLVSGALLAAVTVVGIWVIPTFAQVFAAFGAELPLITRWLLAFADFLRHGTPWLAAGTLAVGVAIHFFLAHPQGRRWWDRHLLGLPLIGPVHRHILLARLARGLAMGFKSGLPMGHTLQALAQAVDNRHGEAAVQHMAQGMERGAGFGQAARESGLFTPLALQMILVGEESGTLDRMMEETADFYERESDHAIANLQAAVEPLLTVVVALFVLMLALGIFLPMWELGHAALRR